MDDRGEGGGSRAKSGGVFWDRGCVTMSARNVWVIGIWCGGGGRL